VKLDLMMLANYAEVAPNGLLYLAGGGWDTINLQAPVEDVPEGVVAVMQGFLVIKLLFHPTETDRHHEFEVNVMDEDGVELAKTVGQFEVPRDHDLPAAWLQNFNIVLPVSGIPLPRASNFVVNLTVNGQWVGDRPFRVIQHFED